MEIYIGTSARSRKFHKAVSAIRVSDVESALCVTGQSW